MQDRPGALSLYRLIPQASDDDPNWDRAPSHGEVLVCARSPADARVVAAEAEGDFLQTNAAPGDGTSTRMASAFRDDKLYKVIEEEGAGSAERGVVSGDFSFPVLRA